MRAYIYIYICMFFKENIYVLANCAFCLRSENQHCVIVVSSLLVHELVTRAFVFVCREYAEVRSARVRLYHVIVVEY